MTNNYTLSRSRRCCSSTLHPISGNVICLVLRPAWCQPLACVSKTISLLPHAPPSFYILSNMVPPPRRINTSISDPVHYRSRRLVSLFTAHNLYYLGTLALSIQRMSAPIANDNVYISGIILHDVIFSCSSSDFSISCFISQQSRCVRQQSFL